MSPAPLAAFAAVLLMFAVQLIALVSTATPAQSAPGDRPVDIVIESITPEVGAPGTVIEIRGRFVNTTDIPVTDLAVRLQRGVALETRTDLADNDSDPVEANDSSTPFVALSRTLAGSGVLPFTYTTTPEELRVSASGAYPLLVNVNGRAGSDPESRVGEQVILLPYFAQPPTAITGLSWLWPLVANPERNAAGVFTGSEFTESLRPAGRLDKALAAVENSPDTDGSNPAPDPVTLAVDPALLEAVQILAGGDYQVLVDGQQQTSSAASTDAANWLARLRTLAANLPVVPLVYADPDLAALISRGQRPAVERLLSDGPSGDLIQEILGVSPIQSMAWPPDGSAANPAVVDTLAEHGATQVIAEDRLTFLPEADAGTLEPISTIQTQSGPITALVGDHVLSGLLQGDVTKPGTQATAQQRFLAELVVTAAEGLAQPRHLLLTPRRNFDPATAGVLMTAAARQPWLATEQVVDLDAAVSAPVARTVLAPAPESRTIPESQLSVLIEAMRARDDFASTMTDPDTDLLALDRALARAATSNRGPDPALGEAAVRDVAAAVTALGATVGIVAPANGTYSLASADAPLVLTVVNDNPFTVEVTVRLAPRGAPGVTTTNVVQVLPAQTRTTIPVPANVQRSGSFTVIASISSPAGSLLGTPVQLRVQSTVYGPVALAITFGAAALLALLFARRSVKYWRARRRPLPAPDAGRPEARLQPGAADAPITEPLLVEPPPRSPV
ncbi:MAG: DUF6049 family protein [Actinomycetota bacterium]|nr:DUF6049 family protein [Actinomycetota bacterium]